MPPSIGPCTAGLGTLDASAPALVAADATASTAAAASTRVRTRTHVTVRFAISLSISSPASLCDAGDLPFSGSFGRLPDRGDRAARAAREVIRTKKRDVS